MWLDHRGEWWGVDRKQCMWRGGEAATLKRALEALGREIKSQAEIFCQLKDLTSSVFWDHNLGGITELEREAGVLAKMLL